MRYSVFLALLGLSGTLAAPVVIAPIDPAPQEATRLFEYDPIPLVRAFGHADQEAWVDFLNAGFCNLEVDVHFIEGELRIGHDCDEPSQCRKTFKDTYLKPLMEVAKENGGNIYKLAKSSGLCHTVTLMPDMKSEGPEPYEYLDTVLRELAAEDPTFLTRYVDNVEIPGALHIVVTGNRPTPDVLLAQKVRYTGLDGRFTSNGEMDGQNDPLGQSIYPWVSQSFKSVFPNTTENMNEDQMATLRNLVNSAQGKGQKIRFWATAEDLELWRTLLDSSVNVINTDRYLYLAHFLFENNYVFP